MDVLYAEYKRWREWERERKAAEPLVECPRCSGDGFVFGTVDWVICPVCEGARAVDRD